MSSESVLAFEHRSPKRKATATSRLVNITLQQQSCGSKHVVGFLGTTTGLPRANPLKSTTFLRLPASADSID